MAAPTLLALDFDGVLCNGLIEYFQTAWKAYGQLFDGVSPEPPAGLAERFYPLRPVIETGWEMPLLLHALLQGVDDEAVLADWSGLVSTILAETEIQPERAMAAVDGVRDTWIQTDLEGWLSLHQFYPGVIDRLHQAIADGVVPVIISTKEGRFIQALLARSGVNLPPAHIFGKERQQPKATTLKQLLQAPPTPQSSPPTIWFLEDRLQTLHRVKNQAELTEVSLFLADWGYNTEAEKHQAQRDSRIHLLSLSQLVREFSTWTLVSP